MSILSWLKSKKRFTRKSSVDEFQEYAKAEEKRLRSSDTDFDADTFQQAVELVLQKLEPTKKEYSS